MRKVPWFGKSVSGEGEYARKEEFACLFERERLGLQRLALLLTANSEAAKRCLILAFRECIANTSVSKEWIGSWTRRIVIHNAISLVIRPDSESSLNTNDDSDIGLLSFPEEDSFDGIAQSESILDLPDFDRFVFVICVLERYSVRDCALLLGKSPREINEARQRAGNKVGRISETSGVS